MKIPNLPENKNKVQIRRIQIPIKLPFMQVGRIAFEIWIFYKSFHSNKDSVLYVSNTAGRELCVRSIAPRRDRPASRRDRRLKSRRDRP